MATFPTGHLASTAAEFNDLVDSGADWIVRSHDDLHRYREEDDSPLAKLSDADYREFADALHFHDGGVDGGTYKPLMSLPIPEIFKIYNRFGMSNELAFSAHEYGCTGGHCEYSFWKFCSSRCKPAAETANG